jgi:hypothetical protein
MIHIPRRAYSSETAVSWPISLPIVPFKLPRGKKLQSVRQAGLRHIHIHTCGSRFRQHTPGPSQCSCRCRQPRTSCRVVAVEAREKGHERGILNWIERLADHERSTDEQRKKTLLEDKGFCFLCKQEFFFFKKTFFSSTLFFFVATRVASARPTSHRNDTSAAHQTQTTKRQDRSSRAHSLLWLELFASSSPQNSTNVCL